MALPWLQLGLGLLSGFLGDSNKSTATQDQTQIGSTVSAQTGETQTEQATNQTQSQATQQQTQQQTRTDQFGNVISEQAAEQIGATTGTQVGTVNRLDDVTKGLLTHQVQDLLSLSNVGGEAAAARIAEIQAADPSFDPDAFVRGVMDSASSRIGADLESGIARIEQDAGVNRGGNSAAALLSSRLQNDARANLAGINADAQARAAEIATSASQSRTGEIATASQSLSQNIQGMIGALLQASQVEQTDSAQQQQQISTQRGQEQSQQSQTGTTDSSTTGTTTTDTATTQTGSEKSRIAGTSDERVDTKSKSTGSDTSGGGLGGIVKAVSGMLSADW